MEHFLSVRFRTSIPSGQQALELPFHNAVAFARSDLQRGPVQDSDVTAHVVDDAGPLQSACGHRHTRPAHAQHGGQEFLGERQPVTVAAVMRHQQPAGKSLVNAVGTVAGGCLGDLGKKRRYVAEQRFAQGWASIRGVSKGARPDAPSLAGHLHQAFLGDGVGAQEDGDADHAVPPHHADFQRTTPLEQGKKGPESGVREIDVLDRFVRSDEHLLERQIDRVQVRAQQPKILGAQSRKQSIADSGLRGLCHVRPHRFGGSTRYTLSPAARIVASNNTEVGCPAGSSRGRSSVTIDQSAWCDPYCASLANCWARR
ncbi:protein of unknown function (plasmid) [Azospirillum baldaniorum]|uniref:Uncharacterized protein n=1 Tax=Azospirillum baldaniorum TaxID=1064539 RepID=A0A9P1JWA0_9PROT|nr:protein of unknown function [Azospirillum baldaniorum]